MPDELRKAKLTANQQIKVLKLIAEGRGPTRICEYLKQYHDIDISEQAISQGYMHNPRYKDRIARIRTVIDKRLASHPLASKVNRLNYIQEALEEALTYHPDKLYFDKFGNEVGKIEVKRLGVVPALIKEAREEFEGSKGGESTAGLAVMLIELIKKADGGLKGVDGIRITRTEYPTLNRFMAKSPGDLLPR